jgi:hypothetical protein
MAETCLSISNLLESPYDGICDRCLKIQLQGYLKVPCPMENDLFSFLKSLPKVDDDVENITSVLA